MMRVKRRVGFLLLQTSDNLINIVQLSNDCTKNPNTQCQYFGLLGQLRLL